MDLSAITTSTDFGAAIETKPNTQASISNSDKVVGGKTEAISVGDKDDKKTAKQEDVKKTTETMNQFLEAMNVNIRFKIHQKTNELMVQIIDQSNNKVLKEFPPHEFLDTIAAIRNYVGMLLDKKI